jgi:RimJ/RimL family protein N-acetyltransferase
VIVTARTRLTTWLPSDLADLHALQANPATMRYMRSGVEDRQQAEARLEMYRREQAVRGWTKWRVENATGGMIGRAGFKLSAEGRYRELGYVLAPEQWGQGLATELAQALVRWHHARPETGIASELPAWAFPENGASRRVLEKVGFALCDEHVSDGTV